MIQFYFRGFNEKILFVRFYKTESGNEPVKEWLYSLEKEDRKIIGTDIKTVEFGFPVGIPLVRKVDTKHKLWEVRTNLQSDKIARVIFTIYKDCMVLLHGFIKKDQKPLSIDCLTLNTLESATSVLGKKLSISIV